MFDSYNFQDFPHFDSLNLSNTSLCNFLLVFWFGWQDFLHSCIHIFFVKILSFGFCLVNSECDAYVSVDHSLAYSHPKMFQLFVSLILSLA